MLVRNKSEFNKCTLESLTHWMKKNPSAFIVTDMKEDNLRGLKIIAETIPEFERRIIPQVYDPRNYNKVKRMGYKQIIWTLYRYGGSNDEVVLDIPRRQVKAKMELTFEDVSDRVPLGQFVGCNLDENCQEPLFAHLKLDLQ